ncbi:MAG: Regulator of nucleoside diphosphate kinase [Candidatus Omnitrophica bacterium ADurb.Bin205]|nr:MAG: Regulator of nucleoside diphosphate kinase [Candidatus Omnitrophica bacterium ADurb.Bin205]
MAGKQIYITDSDIRRLKDLVKVTREFKREKEKYLKELEGELDRAKIVNSEDIPEGIITMNSKILLKNLDSDEEFIYWLVFPPEADPDQNKISILTPIGTALLGYRVGDTIEWDVPGGIARLKVKKILYQPEAAGDYHL